MYELFVRDIKIVTLVDEENGLLVITTFFPHFLGASSVDRVGELLHWINSWTHGAKWGLDPSVGAVTCSCTLIFENTEPPEHTIDSAFRACIGAYERCESAVRQVALWGVDPLVALRQVFPARSASRLEPIEACATMRDVVEQFIAESGIEATLIPHPEMLGWAFTAGGHTCLISLSEGSGHISCQVFLEEAAPSSTWTRVSELLARINHRALNSCTLQLDFDDGQVSSGIALVCGASVLPVEVVANMARSCVEGMRNFSEVILLVMRSSIAPGVALSRVLNGGDPNCP